MVTSAPTSQTDESLSSLDKLPLKAVENIRHIVDNYIVEISSRKLVSSDEVVDVLLDIRQHAMKGQ